MMIFGIQLNTTHLMYYSMAGVIIWIGLMFSTHKISIESMLRVRNGFVNHSGRYKKVIDKETSLEYLKPMFGKKWLPIAPMAAFQKVESVPLIGATRQGIYLFPGTLPCSALLPDGKLFDFNIQRWVYMKERHKMIKKIKKKDIIIFLSIYLPIMIIAGTVMFFSLLVFLEIKLNWGLSNRFTEITEMLMHLYGG